MDIERSAGFRVLLAEDDPVSRTFLREAVQACGAAVADCVGGLEALALAREHTWDLLILDHHLPGLNGDIVVATLRADPDAASRAAPAIATTAAREIDSTALRQAGFAEVLQKPMGTAILRAALHRHGCALGARLDDEGALRTCGSAAAVTRLRRLFAEQELPKIQNELAQMGNDLKALRPILHRLRAACGFCGARTLAEAGAELNHAIAAGAGAAAIETALEMFRTAIKETRAALHAHLAAEATEPVD